MIADLGRRVRLWTLEGDPWTNVYGLARTLLALGTALTLIFSHSAYLFHPVLGSSTEPPFHTDHLFELGFFYLFGSERLEVARWAAAAVLLVVASGWRPRYTGWLHFWISWSLLVNGSLVDGGDQITSNIALLLMPITLTDSRRWHWQPPSGEPCSGADQWRRLIAIWFFLLIRIQVASVYLHSAAAKFSVEDWANGTACYYWLTNPLFGTWMSSLVNPIVANGLLVTAITWGTIMLEYVLSMGLLLARQYKAILLLMGIALHTAILVFHGLVSFSIAMFGALILYLHPTNQPFRLAFIASIIEVLRNPARVKIEQRLNKEEGIVPSPLRTKSSQILSRMIGSPWSAAVRCPGTADSHRRGA